MSRFLAAIYDWFMRPMEEACGAAWRGALLADVAGEVLELGAGTGRNLDHYRAERVARLTLAEPDPHMRRRLERALVGSALARHGAVVDWRADALRVADASVDVVVSTLVLCTVPSPEATLAEVRRVLRPGGRLVFIEHVIAEQPGRRAWQRRLEPVWKRLADGCHLTRDTEQTIAGAGFSFDSLTRESARKAMPVVRPTIRGVARSLGR